MLSEGFKDFIDLMINDNCNFDIPLMLQQYDILPDIMSYIKSKNIHCVFKKTKIIEYDTYIITVYNDITYQRHNKIKKIQIRIFELKNKW